MKPLIVSGGAALTCPQSPDDSAFAGASFPLISDSTKGLYCAKWQLDALLFSVLLLKDKYYLSNPTKFWFVLRSGFGVRLHADHSSCLYPVASSRVNLG